MKSFYILFVVLFSLSINAQNFLTNGTFDDDTGWTFVNQYNTDSVIDVNNTPNDSTDDVEAHLVAVSIENGSLNITHPNEGQWTHVGVYTSVNLDPGFYQLDFDVAWTGLNEGWGEFYIGSAEPSANQEYSGDAQIFKLLNGWDHGKDDYSGKATATPAVVANSQNGVFEISSSGTYYFLYRTGGPSYGSQTFDNISITSSNQPLSSSFSTTINGSTATFTNTSVSADSYSWDFGDGNTSSEESPTHTYTTDGDYYVKLTATSTSANESKSSVDWITIGASSNILTSTDWNDNTGWTSFNTDPDGNTRASVSFGNGQVSFIKSPDGGDWSGYGIYQEVNLEAGTYQFDVKGKYADISDVWFEAHLGVSQPTDPADYGNDDTKLLKIAHGWGSVKSADDYATNIGADDGWVDNNATLTPDNGFFTISASGTYYLVIKAGGGTYGSITTDDVNGIMSASNPILIPSSNTLDVKEIVVPSFGFYPNPASIQLTFVGNVEGEVVQVFDVLGREHLNEVIVKDKLAVDKLDSGLYFLKIKSQVQRLIIK